MPTNLFSTKSILPIPFSPPKTFNLCNILAGDNSSPFKATGSPFKNSSIISVGLSGASKGDLVLE